MRTHLYAATSVVTFLATGLLYSSAMRLGGGNYIVVTLIFAALGLAGAAVIYWWHSRRALKEGAAPAGGDGAEIAAILREAENRLAASPQARGARLSTLPLVFVIGEPRSAKTSTVLNCGAEPELLSGQVYQSNNEIAPTLEANLWYAGETILAEAGSRIYEDTAAWRRFIRSLAPARLRSAVGGGTAPRAALVCVDAEMFLQPGAAAALPALARKLNARLGEISQMLGVRLPVYVLFTRSDRIAHLADFVHTLTNEEAGQPVGVTLPLLGEGESGVYAEQQARRLTEAFNRLFHSLCDHRLELLARENDPAKLPGCYEFPRELSKLRTPLVQFLVDLCRPSQLRASPFLRGFYFSGVRPVVVSEAQSLGERAQAEQLKGFAGSVQATGIFQTPGAAPPASYEQAPAARTRRVPQWLFLPQLFHYVILKDAVARGAAGSSVKTSALQRVLLGAAAALFLICALSFTVSYFGNRALVREAEEAARALPAGPQQDSLASAEDLAKLERARAVYARLAAYEKEGPPWRLRWGLYAGSQLYPHARRAYYNGFHRLLFAQTRQYMERRLERVPPAPDPAYEYGPTYDLLKAYLIVTSEYRRSTKTFLGPALTQFWLAGRETDPAAVKLAQAQFDFFAEDLKQGNPFRSGNDLGSIDQARRYLAQFSGVERVYNFMLAEASRVNPKVNFNEQFPGSAEAVVNNRDVAGAFTRKGWEWMQAALKRVDEFFGGERWVLGDYSQTMPDKAQLAQQISERYERDFIEAWRGFLRNTTVRRYSSPKDAAHRLNLLSSNETPLLRIFWLVTQHTSAGSDKVKQAFQAVYRIVPPPAASPVVVLPENQAYVGALLDLQQKMDQVGGDANNTALIQAAKSSASNALLVTRQMAVGFPPDLEAQVHKTAQKLLEDPITAADAVLVDPSVLAANNAARDLCAVVNPLTRKFPFDPKAEQEVTLEELNRLLRPGEGLLWTTYEQRWKNVVRREGGRWVANREGGLKVNPAFVAFFDNLARFSEALYPGNANAPRLTYSLQPVAGERVEGATLILDGKTARFSGAMRPEQFVWPGPQGQQLLKLEIRLRGGSGVPVQDWQGLWSLFRFFTDADQFTRSGSVYNLQWNMRQGREGRVILTYNFLLDVGNAPPLFSKEWLSGLRCVATAALP